MPPLNPPPITNAVPLVAAEFPSMRVVAPRPEFCESMLDKWTMAEQMSALGMSVARTWLASNVRGAGVAWCAGFGRLGGVAGPLLGGFLIGGGFALDSIFYVLSGLGVLGLLLTLLVPIARGPRELRSTLIEPTPKAAAAVPNV